MLLDYQELKDTPKTDPGAKPEEKPDTVMGEEEKEAAGGVQPGGNGAE